MTYAICATLCALAALPLISASCSSQRAKADEPAAYERLRVLTRGSVVPAESVITNFVNDYAGTRTGALARIVQARAHLERDDFAGAAALLDAREIAAQTSIGDHALFMRADALEKAGRRVEARAAYEQVSRDFPDSARARDASLHVAQMLFADAQQAAVPLMLKKLTDKDDADALLLTAKAEEQGGNSLRSLAAYRRLYFYAPVSALNDTEAASALARLNSTTAPANVEEALTRAEKLYAAKRYADATVAYGELFARFPDHATPQLQLKRGIAAFNARRAPDTVAALTAVPASAGDTRAEALYNLTQHYAHAKQWDATRASVEELRRAYPANVWTMRALVVAGQTAKEAKNQTDALYFDRLAVQMFPGAAEVAGAQFETAWAAHDANNFAESSRLLIEHLAAYADRNTDNRGKAGYWAARDSERAGRLAEAGALYRAMLSRYDANWYGSLAKQRLDQKEQSGASYPQAKFAGDSAIARAVANLQTVSVPEENAGASEDAKLTRADQLNVAGLDDLAHSELDSALADAPASPRVSLAKARIYRAHDDNLQAFNVLRKSYPDYSQMKPEELTREEWDVFYPLEYWNTISQEARAKNLDPYTVAGLIRQESVFNARAVSAANAFGLMQLLPGTARLTARTAGVESDIKTETLFDPVINIKLGTTYLRSNLDKFGRIEYVAAAYNAGPGRVVQWRATLPLQIDEWAEAVPFKETRGYVQGVVRNTLQYRRLYDADGHFRPEVGASAVRPLNNSTNVRPRRASNEEEE